MLGAFGVFIVDFVFFLHINSAGSFPKALTAAEEKKYLEQMAAGDHHARQKLIEHNLRLVAHIAEEILCR